MRCSRAAMRSESANLTDMATKESVITTAGFRTLEGFAIGILLDAQAIRECEHHGYMKDGTDPHAWDRAREIAARERFRSTTKEERLKAIDTVMRSVGDTCPDCK